VTSIQTTLRAIGHIALIRKSWLFRPRPVAVLA